MGRDAHGEGTKLLGLLSYKPGHPAVSQGWEPQRRQNIRSPALKETLGTTSLKDVKPDSGYHTVQLDSIMHEVAVRQGASSSQSGQVGSAASGLSCL